VKEIRIGTHWVGDPPSNFIIAEIASTTRRLGDRQKADRGGGLSDCNAVKIQKRTVEIVYARGARKRRNPSARPTGISKRVGFGERGIGRLTPSQDEEIMWSPPAGTRRAGLFAGFHPPAYKSPPRP